MSPRPFAKQLGGRADFETEPRRTTAVVNQPTAVAPDLVLKVNPDWVNKIDAQFSRVELWFDSPEQAAAVARLMMSTLSQHGKITFERMPF